MIILKNREEIELMKKAGAIAIGAIYKARDEIRPGITTKALDTIIEKYILSHGAKPSFKGYGGFPASACISVNSQVIHGIPSNNIKLCEGDIVSIDAGAYFKGFHGDCARTYGVGKISDEAQKLIDVTRESFYRGIEYAKPGYRLGDLGAAIDEFVIDNGFTTVTKFVGHGIGNDMHEDPAVPNQGTRGRGQRFIQGMAIAVEPMVNQGASGVYTLNDKWTVVTKDGSLSAHYENSIAITADKPLILTTL